MSSYSSQTSAEQVAQDCHNAIANKTVLVTGVSPGGLGAEFAKVIAIHGPSLLILASRDMAKAQQTAQEIADIAPRIPTRLLELDLHSQAQVRIAAKEVLAYKEDIDVLVNNAGVMASPFSLTDDGIESQFATNHVGHFLFTNLIMEKLVRPGKPCRVVNVSSNGHLLSSVRFHDWNFDEGENYDPWLAYGQSKSANMLFSMSLAQKLGSKGLTSVSLHPGTIETNLARGDWDEMYKSLAKWFTVLGYFRSGQREITWKSMSQGVATHVFAAFHSSISADENNGGFVQDCAVVKPEEVRSWARDEIEAERLWKLTEDIVGETFEY
ncbi:short-chain dehydrogenase [Aspergillus eucalypticola CBS 122712]|uniref:Short-chain dehydrogenase n=1 Tax=Aspergillus eucalypticola (strain CBS 122712 / IBT 29274) TaxID=1448314 RepID=A0A317WCL4_ASPEC|nr:short-chain dehydrogenase [Aspergillus eucalypticola CBS 122712]PWY84276.1 short-chain dehydrogenase [Aspergillus eucalypticola CBS 122712]